MKLTFAAGDPGGSRAVLPVVYECAKAGFSCSVVRHGFLGQEVTEKINISLISKETVSLNKTDCFIYGSSSTDLYALTLAKQAKQAGKPIIHVCDNWSTYRKRLELEGEIILPDRYCVMDEIARNDAIKEGIPASSLAVTGQPALANAINSMQHLFTSSQSSKYKVLENDLILVFVSEDYHNVCGSDTTKNGHCGFTEYMVLDSLTKQLADICPDIFLYILPHPKHNAGEMEALWEKTRGCLHGTVVRPADPRELFAISSGVVGMASILLYEAWLYGFPTLSLQPDCRFPGLKRFAELEGIFYSSDNPAPDALIRNWLAACNKKIRKPRPEQKQHEQAAIKILKTIEAVCQKNTQLNKE